MSLFNRNGNTPNTIIIKEITRSRNESFGESVMKDAALAAGPAAKITNSIYRNKALKAIAKRIRRWPGKQQPRRRRSCRPSGCCRRR